MRIWKWPLEVTGTQTIQMPADAKVLAVQVQDGKPQAWVLVNECADFVERTFATYGTGHPVSSDPGKYVATYQLHDGEMVFHVFEQA